MSATWLSGIEVCNLTSVWAALPILTDRQRWRTVLSYYLPTDNRESEQTWRRTTLHMHQKYWLLPEV